MCGNCDGSGWLYDTSDNALTVKDRCMFCNEPPWYAERRRQQRIERWWPWLVFGGIIAMETLLPLLMLVLRDYL